MAGDPVRLAIADPPYPPSPSRRRASRWYGDRHTDAVAYDLPVAHRALVAQLAGFDGWALACPSDSVGLYGPPADTRVCVWVVPNAAPGSGRILSRWEAVIVSVPAARRHAQTGPRIPDYLVAPAPRQGFPGEKPPAWSRWVLDLLGHDPDTDTVADLFPGSGAVTAQIAQGVLL